MLSRQERVQNLRQRLQVAAIQSPLEAVSSGNPAFDRLLGGGLRPGALCELFAAEGSGATSVALLAARQICGQATANRYLSRAPQSRALVVVDADRRFYPPAAAEWQVDLAKLIVVRPASLREHHWTLHQALSCPAVGAVLCWPDRLDARMFRRLQLAAETAGSLGLLVRPLEARSKASWAQVQLLVEPLPSEAGRRVRIELLRSRGNNSGQSVELDIDERGTLNETDTLFVVPQLASATPWPHAAGA